MQNASEAGAEPTASAPESSQAQALREATREAAASQAASHQPPQSLQKPIELGGPSGPEPTRFGDWERKGRCIDF